MINAALTKKEKFFQRGEINITELPVRGILLVVLLALVMGWMIRPVSPRVVSVSGQGKKTVMADQIDITITATTTQDTASGAMISGTALFNKVQTAVNNVAPSKVSQLTPQVVPTQANSISPIQYQYVNGVQITVDDMAKLKAVTDQVIEAGGQVAAVRYRSKEQDKLANEVRSLAVDDARQKARQLAGANGSSVGRVLSIAEQGSNAQTGSAVTQTSSTTPGMSSEIEIQSVVSVAYEIKPWWRIW